LPLEIARQTKACPIPDALFFHGREVVVLAHALTKEDEIPRADIARAVKRMNLFKMNPNAHTYESQD